MLQTPAQTRAEVRERWLESIELDMPSDVVREARERMGKDAEFKQDGQALALYARALSATGGEALAFELLDKAQVSKAEEPYVQLALARLELLKDDLDGLLRRLSTGKQLSSNPPASAAEQDAIVRYPQHADSWWLLGKAQARMGQAERAAPYLQRFVQTWRMHPEAPAAWHQLSQLALARRDLESAKKYREQGQNLSTWHGYYKTRRLQAQRNPQDALPRFGLAQLWSSVQEYARANQEIERCLALDAEFARGWALKGELERKQNRMDSARAAYTRALELDGSLGDARYNRALLALQAGLKELAEQDLSTLVDGPESSAERYLGAHLSLARLLEDLGRQADAEVRFARYRQLGGKDAL